MEPEVDRADDGGIGALVQACNHGNPSAWRTLVERYRRLIIGIPVASYRIGEAEAEEIFQRVSIKLFDNLARLRNEDSLAAWLVAVTRNECRSYLRESRRWEPIEDEETQPVPAEAPDALQALYESGCEHTLSRVIERLDPASRALLEELFYEEPAPSYAEIARRRGCAVGSIGPTRARCLEKLRNLYTEAGGPQPWPA